MMFGDDTTDQDRDLRDRFSAMRREVEAGVPPISMPRPNAHRHGWRWSFGKIAVVANVCLATMIAAAVWLPPIFRVPRDGMDQQRELGATSISASITSWKPATDFLLDTPGREVLRGLPAFGDPNRATIAPGSGEGRRHVRKQLLP